MDMRKTRIFLIIAIMLILMTGTAGCARLQSGIHDLHGSIIGNEYTLWRRGPMPPPPMSGIRPRL